MVGDTVIARSLCAGELFRTPGALVTCEPGDGPLRGLEVRVTGDALERGLVTLTRARARPFSARLAPWEASGWEHGLFAQPGGRDGEVGCVLRAARVPPASSAAARPPSHKARDALAHTVWVEVEGRAMKPGEGTLSLALSGLDARNAGAVRVHSRITVRAGPRRAVWSAYVAWDATRAECGGAVRTALDGLARWVASLPRGPRAVFVHGTAPASEALRAGCAVMGPAGLSGDARFRELSRRLRTGGLERLWLLPPASTGMANAREAAGELLEVLVVHAGRFAPAPVELVISAGNSLVPEAGVTALSDWVAATARDPRVIHAFVAAHDWVPSLVDATPWELLLGWEPARDARTLRARGRVDPVEAHTVVLARDAREAHRPALDRARGATAWSPSSLGDDGRVLFVVPDVPTDCASPAEPPAERLTLSVEPDTTPPGETTPCSRP